MRTREARDDMMAKKDTRKAETSKMNQKQEKDIDGERIVAAAASRRNIF